MSSVFHVVPQNGRLCTETLKTIRLLILIATTHVSKPTHWVTDTTVTEILLPARLVRVTGGKMYFHRQFQVTSGAQRSLLLSRGYRSLFPQRKSSRSFKLTLTSM
jgi:hypothetical protein